MVKNGINRLWSKNREKFVPTLAIVVLKQEHEPVLTIKEVPPMSQKLIKKLVKFKNAVMTLGLHGVLMIHAPIGENGDTKENARDKDMFKFLRVHKKENQFKKILKRRSVVIEAIGEPVSLIITALHNIT